MLKRCYVSQAYTPLCHSSRCGRHPEAIEFLLSTDGELPIRAIPAVLFVGDVIVNDYEQLDSGTYLFRAFEPDRLPAGAPNSLGWPGRPDKTQDIGFRYEPPPNDVTESKDS